MRWLRRLLRCSMRLRGSGLVRVRSVGHEYVGCVVSSGSGPCAFHAQGQGLCHVYVATQYGDSSVDEKQLPSIRMSFYPNYEDDYRDMQSLEFTLGGHGIGQNSEVGDVLRVLQRLMAEGLWDRAVERLYAQPDLLIDWDNPTGGSEEDNG